MVLHELISVGTMLAFNALAISFLVPLVSLANSLRSLQEGDTHLNRVLKIIEHKPEQESGKKYHAMTGKISLKEVSFRYSIHDEDVVKKISTEIETGQKVAIVGATGAGKSTIGMLLVGLFKPQSGDILYDDQSIS